MECKHKHFEIIANTVDIVVPCPIVTSIPWTLLMPGLRWVLVLFVVGAEKKKNYLCNSGFLKNSDHAIYY